MVEPIRPDELLAVIRPVRMLLASDALGFSDVVLRSYAQAPAEVEVPPLRDYGLALHQGAAMTMDRRIDGGPWKRELLIPGTVAVLTRAAPSEWHWSLATEVTHLYLSRDLLARVSADVFDRDIADVQLRDVLMADDEILRACIENIAEEVRTHGLGGQLLVDACATQACVQLLRRYADITFHEDRVHDAGFSRLQAKIVAHYIEEHIDQKLRLAELAQVARVSVNHFLRQFKLSFGCAPHVYVIRRRLERAQHLLTKTHLQIKEVAADTGFADQSHMSRAFRRYLRTTPGSFRDTSGS
jgi:AraC family transcriptional regulator